MNEMRKLIESVDALSEDDYARMQHGPEDYLDGQRFVGEDVDMDAIAEIEQHLEEAYESLYNAVEALRAAQRIAMLADFGNPIAGQLRAYTIPHLQRWMEDSNQPGSLPSIHSMLEDEQSGDYDEE